MKTGQVVESTIKKHVKLRRNVPVKWRKWADSVSQRSGPTPHVLHRNAHYQTKRCHKLHKHFLVTSSQRHPLLSPTADGVKTVHVVQVGTHCASWSAFSHFVNLFFLSICCILQER